MVEDSKSTGTATRKSLNQSTSRVGLGITTYNRPQYLIQCLEAVDKHLLSVVDVIYVYNDGSSLKYPQIGSKHENFHYHEAKQNKGVSKAKNWLLRKLMADGCDYLFLMEDDILVKSPKAITKYIEYSQKSGVEHFNFAHHGIANKGKLRHRANGIDVYGNPVGAWQMFTRRVIEEVGYFDENFFNAWEHIEHTWRISKAGYTTPWPYACVDLTASKRYLTDIPGSIDNSSITPRRDWMDSIVNGLEYWKNKDKDFPLDHILNSLHREEQEARDINSTANQAKTR